MTSRGAVRVLLVINGTEFGGSESALAELARHLDSRGHETHVLSMKYPGRTGQQMIASGLRVHTLGMSEAVNPWNLLVAIFRLSAWLRHNPVDVVQSFLPRANIVSRVANRLAPGYRPHLSCERSTDFNRSLLVCRLNRWTARCTDRVLAVSQLVREVLVTRDRLPREKIHILENGLDIRAADSVPPTNLRAELNMGTRDVVFCSVGRLIPDKGYRYLIRAMARLRSERTPHLVLVGEGPEEETLRAEVSRLNLVGNVHFVGFRKDVLGILKDVDAFVLSSLEEGIPMVLLEAMACSLPIIGTDVGGVGDLVVDGETAILVPPAERWQAAAGDRVSEATQSAGVEALGEALSRFAAEPQLRVRMGNSGRRRLVANFSVEQVVDRLEGHYEQLGGWGS